ncbi:nucleotidyltransferase family protein [Paenibacillus woosongensis]|uniref:NTP transferase domain-containing protein n=1 Tax=Paenibacillus woosongensis TaxID=307580 RepID=A0A7X2Z5T3_9BACL|nr:nucleotidyltransferase family protein [Paenibacillus woosongensis]MUG47396.1 NTP transferase domain-containing protein [Paenibacillus woosongensis]
MRENPIVGIYLAAGQSTRMGSDKLQLPLGSMKLGNYALAAALNSKLDYVVVIRNDAAGDWMDDALYRAPVKRKWSSIYCPEARLGQAYSLRCGVKAALAMGAAAAMVLLADQPLITNAMINELLAYFQAEQQANSSVGFTAASYEGLPRPPVIFAQQMFPQLLELQGDRGACHLIRREGTGICLDFLIADLFMDVDDAEDYRALLDKVAARRKS